MNKRFFFGGMGGGEDEGEGGGSSAHLVLQLHRIDLDDARSLLNNVKNMSIKRQLRRIWAQKTNQSGYIGHMGIERRTCYDLK